LANKDNQHYIPQLYLRNFSNNNDRITVGIFNRENDIFFANAPIKGQASKKHYYGKDQIIEDFFAEYEGVWAQVLAKITRQRAVLKKDSIEYSQLLTFIGTMAMRTPTTIELIKEQFAEAEKIIGGNHTISEPISMSKMDAVLESFRLTSSVIKSLRDLDYKIITNETNTSFITSDHPLVKYNKLFVSKQLKLCKTGYSTIGLILLLPLSSNTLIILYDGGAYDIGPKKKWIFKIKKDEEVKMLNSLQFLNQNGQVYFCNKISEQQIRSISNDFIKQKLANQPEVKGIDEHRNNELKSTLLIFSSTEQNLNLRFDWLGISENARKLNLVDGKSYVRKNTYHGN
jgi:hypothetical protein